MTTENRYNDDFYNQFFGPEDVPIEDIFRKDVNDVVGHNNSRLDSKVRKKVGEGDMVWLWGLDDE